MGVSADEVVRCTLEMHYETFGAIQNVFHLQNIGGAVTTEEALADVVEVLETLMGIIAGFIAILQVVDGVRTYNVTTPEYIGYGQFVDNTPFTGSGEVQPTQVCVGLNLGTMRPGIYGRKYWGAGSAGMTEDGGLLVAGTLVDNLLAGAEMIDDVVATNSIWNYGVITALDGVFLPFTSASAPSMAVIQRRRRLGVGI